MATDVTERTALDSVVVARGVRRVFGEQVVLDGLDLDIAPGEFVALLGRSGSGKSTFLRALGALDPDVEGHLRVPAKQAIVFQDPRLLPWQKVLTNVNIGRPDNARTVPRRSMRSQRSSSRTRRRRGRGRCPGERHSGSRSPGHSSANPNCCCSTNPSELSTHSPGSACTACSRSWWPSTGRPCSS